jgi:hypothetical protein
MCAKFCRHPVVKTFCVYFRFSGWDLKDCCSKTYTVISSINNKISATWLIQNEDFSCRIRNSGHTYVLYRLVLLLLLLLLLLVIFYTIIILIFYFSLLLNIISVKLSVTTVNAHIDEWLSGEHHFLLVRIYLILHDILFYSYRSFQ